MLSTALTLAPAARSRSTVASWPFSAARCNGVQPRAREGKTCFAASKVLEVGEGKVSCCAANLSEMLKSTNLLVANILRKLLLQQTETHD